MNSLARSVDQAQILARLRPLRPDARARWGRMSAPQMVAHLADGYRMALGRRSVGSMANPLTRTLLKTIALRSPMPWPRGIRSVVEVDQERGGTPPGDFATDVASVVDLIEAMKAPERRFEPTHPIFGPMSDADWLRWGWLHADHHLRQFGV